MFNDKELRAFLGIDGFDRFGFPFGKDNRMPVTLGESREFNRHLNTRVQELTYVLFGLMNELGYTTEHQVAGVKIVKAKKSKSKKSNAVSGR